MSVTGSTSDATGLSDALEDLVRWGDTQPLRRRLDRIVETYEELGHLIKDTDHDDHDARWSYETERSDLVADLIAELRSAVIGLGRWEVGR